MDSQLSSVLEEAKSKKLNESVASYITDSQSSIFDETKAFQQYDKSMTLSSVNKPFIPVKFTKSNNNNDNNQTDMDYFNCFDLTTSTAKQPGLRKRPPKFDPSNILNIATEQLDISTDSSDVTFSQKQLDSQEFATYLRKKDKPAKRSEVKSIAIKDLSFEDNFLLEEDGVDDMDGPYSIRSPQQTNNNEDDQMEKSILLPFSPYSSENIEMAVNVMKRKKKLDFSIENHDEKSYLWAKANVSIPITIECSKGDGGKRRIVIKFVRIGAKDDLSYALKNQQFDVKKCKNCVDRETRYPQESFCYVEEDTANIYWHTRYSQDGARVDAEISDEMQKIDLFIQFSCKEKCMAPEIKKGKVMVLVAILENLDGTEISRSCIDNVRVVAYPDRDHNNFLNDANKNNGIESKKICNVTNQYQNPMLNYRKRNSSIIDPCVKNENFNFNIFSKKDYEQNLIVGVPKQAVKEDVEKDDENVAKKPKKAIPKVMRFTVVGEERIGKVIEFLANLEQDDRKNAIKTRNRMMAPLRAVGRVEIFTKIEDWLSTLKMEHLIDNFYHSAILNVGDLLSRYELDDNIFGKLLLSPEEESVILQTFLNFYHVYLFEKRKSNNLTV